MPTRRTLGPKPVTVGIVQLPHAEGLPLPKYETEGAAGLDLAAALPADEPLVLEPMQRALLPTGLVLELPPSLEAQVRPRSGLALRHGITVLNSPGTIDCDYRGELLVLLINLGQRAWTVERGERIAQLVMAPVQQVTLVRQDDVASTQRHSGGFGSTGRSTARANRRRHS